MNKALDVSAKVLIAISYLVAACGLAILVSSLSFPQQVWVYGLGGAISVGFIITVFISVTFASYVSRAQPRLAKGQASFSVHRMLQVRPVAVLIVNAALLVIGLGLTLTYYVSGFSRLTGDSSGGKFYAVDGVSRTPISVHDYFLLLAAHNIWYPVGAALIFLAFSTLGLHFLLMRASAEPLSRAIGDPLKR